MENVQNRVLLNILLLKNSNIKLGEGASTLPPWKLDMQVGFSSIFLKVLFSFLFSMPGLSVGPIFFATHYNFFGQGSKPNDFSGNLKVFANSWPSASNWQKFFSISSRKIVQY